jgi:drug/metabolite transporter (DMT)-like permease
MAQMRAERTGSTLMIGAAGCFTINDALCKWLMPEFTVGQIISMRSLAVLALVATAAIVSRPVSRQLVFGNYKLHTLRAGLLAVSAMLFLTGLAQMPLTNAIALSLTSPLFVAGFARPLLGESVARGSWLAIAAGFVGTLLVLNPSIRDFGWASALPACGAAVSALTDIMTRRMASHETSLSLVISSAVGCLVLGLISTPFGWHWADLDSVGMVSLAGIFILLSYYLMAEAFRCAPAFIVAPFRYSALIWSLMIGFLVWGQMPDISVLAGCAMLASSGWYLPRSSSVRA